MRIATPFASHADLAARWRTLTPAEQALAGTLLGDASQLVLDECPTANLVPNDAADALAARAATLKRVVCAMVKRSMIADQDTAGVSAMMDVSGPFTTQQTFSNPMGDLYLTKAERRALPCGRARAFMIDTMPPREEATPWPPSTP